MAQNCLTDEQRDKLFNRFLEIVEKVEKAVLSYDCVMSAFQLIFDDEIPVPFFKRDIYKEKNWDYPDHRILEASCMINPDDLELVPLLNYGEQNVRGNELERRAKILGADLCQHTAEWLLEHQEVISEEWRGFYFIFPGSVWRDSFGGSNIPYIGWGGGRWYLGFALLDGGFNSHIRLLRPRK